MLNVIDNEIITSVSRTMHRKLEKELPLVGQNTPKESANEFLSVVDMDGCSEILDQDVAIRTSGFHVKLTCRT